MDQVRELRRAIINAAAHAGKASGLRGAAKVVRALLRRHSPRAVPREHLIAMAEAFDRQAVDHDEKAEAVSPELAAVRRAHHG
jgi:hypothetical protein